MAFFEESSDDEFGVSEIDEYSSDNEFVRTYSANVIAVSPSSSSSSSSSSCAVNEAQKPCPSSSLTTSTLHLHFCLCNSNAIPILFSASPNPHQLSTSVINLPSNPSLPASKSPPQALAIPFLEPSNASIPSSPTSSPSAGRFSSAGSAALLSRRRPILLGWLCSLVSVVSLSTIVPKFGRFSALIADLDAVGLRNEGQTIVPGTLQLSAMVAQMLAISPVLSLISAMVIPCMALVIAYLGEELRKISNQANLSVAALSAYLNEIFPAFLFLKANYGEGIENARFEKLARTDLSERLRKKKMKVLIPQIVQIMYFGALFLFCVGSLAISRGSFDGRGMISFITSLVFLIEPIQGIGKAYNEFKQGEPAIVRLFDLIQFKAKVMEKPNAFHVNHVRGEVQFCDISFKYGDNLPLVLNGLNLHIKAGETVALVGPSGGGKTTLAKLLLRLYDPLSGYILIDNHNIQSIRLQSLRRHVGLVSQDITLLSGTVAENIGYWDLIKGIDMGRVEDAARTANADEFIRQLPKGYETDIGPRGSTMSGGQRQRLAIARAVYQNSSILILDEATSALDSRSELSVRQALERLMKNHTVLVIAHRLETVLMAKRVFLLDNGKLEELSHSALLSDRHVISDIGI
ncbi:ABC transporter B family member 29, chloroplastic [Morus notabilis]|uniref:ABC transporter B family member 29, chloroplastic n=2 Tax=Morus notabilis TaxID=981085 RepID=UPI000CED2510|nr:ABC transporter B family member 29, chloroplastic [Morus notabilis]